MKIFTDRFETHLGDVFLAAEARGGRDVALLRLAFVEDDEDAAELEHELVRRWAPESIGASPRRLGPIRKQVREYLKGKRREFDFELVLEGTEFQRRVWDEVRRIPYGKVSNYATIATRAGRPKAIRAAGAANGANPVALVIPCHRVIGSNGSLTGYAFGLERKEALLELEGALPRVP